MSIDQRDLLRGIKTFPSLVKYLRNELDWPIGSDDFEDLTFDYEPDELGIDPKAATKVETIKQLRPLTANQPWGIFFVKFAPKRLPVVVLRRILGQLVFKKRASAKHSEQATWNLNDLLFISNYGEGNKRQINLAHFAENPQKGYLPTLMVLGWDDADRDLKIDHVREEMQNKLRWPDNPDDMEQWRTTWSSVFTLRHREVITTSKKLAERLAELAIAIRKRANEVLALEKEKGPLRKLFQAFRKVLIHDLTEDDFADTYAQTISYGLLSEKLMPQVDGGSSVGLKSLKVMNPFLAELLDECRIVGRQHGLVDFDELGVAEIEDLLNDPQTKYDDILRDFDKKSPEEDPVIHFYEHFLREYDAEKRFQRGVFYTPKPVVSFIVRSADEILRNEFGLEDGLADTTTWGTMAKRHKDLTIPQYAKPDDPFVQILDPATGTGTFLVEVVDVIFKTMMDKWKVEGNSKKQINQLWNEYVSKFLLPRLYGFELMMAPYAIAHMKIGLKLYETGYRFQSDQRVNIFLTNSLEPPHDSSDQLQMFSPALANEAEVGNKVKVKVPTTVVVGNPPYSGFSSNMNPWIDGLLKGQIPDGPKVRTYYEVDGKPLGERKLWLQDDYVKFIRYGQWRIENVQYGILGYISNHGYLDNPTFRGMRQQLMGTFPTISALNLRGNKKKKERSPNGSDDINVFDIEQGVAIGLFRRIPEKVTTKVYHTDLWGSREKKYKKLLKHSENTIGCNLINPNSPHYFFVPRDESNREEYEQYPLLNEVMNVWSVGIVTARDNLTIAFTPDEIWNRVKRFASLEVEEAREEFNLRKDVRDWKVHLAQKDLKSIPFSRKHIVPILYRPFDIRYTYYTGRIKGFIGQPAKAVMHHMFAGPNVGLMASKKVEVGSFRHGLCVSQISESHSVSLKEINYLFPLYLYPDSESSNLFNKREANVNISFAKDFSAALGISWTDGGRDDLILDETVGPEDILHYIYSQLYSETYRKRYNEFLRTDFPRILLTEDISLFRSLSQLGADLVALHLLEDYYEDASWDAGSGPLTSPITTFVKESEPIVVKAHPKYQDGKVYINESCYFDGVPEEAWQFQVGSYQVCHKWLKDRGPKKGNPGRILTDEDITHYQKIVVALNETIRLMDEIDEVIEEHGGWPDAFITN